MTIKEIFKSGQCRNKFSNIIKGKLEIDEIDEIVTINLNNSSLRKITVVLKEYIKFSKAKKQLTKENNDMEIVFLNQFLLN